MKNSKKKIASICIVTILILTVCFALMYLVDEGMNGTIADWFYANYMETWNSSVNGEGTVQMVPNWIKLKSLLRGCFVILTLVLVFLCWGIVHILTKRRLNQEVNLISNQILEFLQSDLEFPKMPVRYSKIENHLTMLKTANIRHEQMLITETQRKNDLITYLAHDLKTPLASVIGYLSLLNEAPDLSAEQKSKYTGVALEKAYRLEQLIYEFFDITRFNLQDIILSEGKINLSFMLQQLADEFYPILSPQNKKAVVQAPDGLTLWGDADKLARVFNNILKNACAYSYDDSIIQIQVESTEMETKINFINQGNPIPQHKLDLIFEKFYRLDSSRSSSTGGSGLGLAIAKEIVQAHGGDITVVSDKTGTVFSVMLPVSEGGA